ncbi:unnamed protein product [Adineta steineri]|uniref:Uncharacterized protein n=1 Tax=Adineta steineri TaxID=433720 RepID=A0A818HLH0_9BILA|nr:unnamed protein product [Adineta steineri]CAF3479597.1 unnamed protein product [Adineta steineri]CAF3510547.1 unnamed protein product [Adineta steineri]
MNNNDKNTLHYNDVLKICLREFFFLIAHVLAELSTNGVPLSIGRGDLSNLTCRDDKLRAVFNRVSGTVINGLLDISKIHITYILSLDSTIFAAELFVMSNTSSIILNKSSVEVHNSVFDKIIEHSSNLYIT